jgi:hypothetical protein
MVERSVRLAQPPQKCNRAILASQLPRMVRGWVAIGRRFPEGVIFSVSVSLRKRQH